ncbi:MAG: YgaP family membrane protein [Geminicoccales bacterium]
MKLNVGTWDRALRVLIGAMLVVLLFTGTVSINTTIGIVAAVAAAVLIVTGAISFCPAYTLIGVRTRSDQA